MTSNIVLYDLKSKGRNSCFSCNVWKTRAALNFKDIPYDTVWMEFPDIASTWKSKGIPPNLPSECLFEYSCPTVMLPDGTYVMESRKIAAVLENLQPSPSFHLNTACPERAQNAVDGLLRTLGPGMMYRIPELLDARGAEWSYEERKKFTGGIPITDFAGQFDWDGAKAPLRDIKAMLSENMEGPYILGKDPSYADLVIVSLWVAFLRVDEGDLIGPIMAFDESLKRHWEACGQWFERNDH